jgi:hypothetical protein
MSRFSHLQAKQNDVRGPDVFVVLDTLRRVLPTAEEDAGDAERRLSEALAEIEQSKKERR